MHIDPFGDGVGIGQLVALGVEQARALALRDEPGQDPGRVVTDQVRFGHAFGGGVGDDFAGQLGLGAQRLFLTQDQVLAQLVELPGADDQHQEAQQVQREDRPPQPRTAERQALDPGDGGQG